MSERRTDLALLILRLSAVGMFVGHGLGKVVRLATGEGDGFIQGVEALGFPFPVVSAWAAALAESVGALAVLVGWQARIGALFVSVTMFVAGFMRHHFLSHVAVLLGLSGADPEVVSSWGNPELAMIYLLVFSALALTGSGRYSLDRYLKRRRRR